MSDILEIFGTEYTGVTGIKATDDNGNILTYIRPSLQTKMNITPTESTQTITPDANYTGLSSVQINAISSSYIGSGIDQRNSSDLSAAGATVTAPAGYYATAATKTIPTDTLTNTIINGAAVLEATNDYAFEVEVNIPAGYHNATTLTKSFSSMLPAPTTEAAAAQVLAGYDLYNHNGQLISGSMTNHSAWNRTLDDNTISVTIPVGYHNGNGTVSHATVAVPNPTITVSNSGLITANGSWTKGFTTNNSYSNTQQLTTKAAATITPGTTNQTIASGTYLTGTQTIVGDADLVASNIISTANIFGVQGSVVVQGYYTGTTAPSSSLGSNGDLYLQTSE